LACDRTAMTSNKRAFIVWHQLQGELVIKAESFFKENWGSLDRPPT
jgi:hypothetical protein